MLVTFSCKVCPNITMFGDVAVRMLRLIGHSGTVPSALAGPFSSGDTLHAEVERSELIFTATR